MRKIFEYIGLITLMCFSFFITEKTTLVVQNVDDLMAEIKENSSKYNKPSINAKIEKNEIIPGVCEKKVNLIKSYDKMKKLGIYEPSYLVYDYIKPTVSLSKNYDKYIISGSPYKEYIYIFIELNESNKHLLTNYNFKNYNFIVNEEFFFNNIDNLSKLISNKNSLLISPTKYTNYKQINKKYLNDYGKNIFCYNQNYDKEFFEICSSNKSHSIKIHNNIKNNNYLYIKKFVRSGSFIKLTLNDELISSINFIEKQINAKGLILSNIDDSISEC